MTSLLPADRKKPRLLKRPFGGEYDVTKTEMTDYYAKRASEYECIYQKPERQENLKQIQSVLAGSFGGLNLLEIACGTGYWTQFACKSARSIVATDYNVEVLDIARAKNYGVCPITFVKADAYTLDGVDGPFSAALVGFWWSQLDYFWLAKYTLNRNAKQYGCT